MAACLTWARRAQPDPVVALKGQRAFPWKLPNDGSVAPGDHICRPFDLTAEFSRWVFSPALAGERRQVWRPHRIIGLDPAPASEQRLWRFAGLRHPGRRAVADCAQKQLERTSGAFGAVDRNIWT